MPKPNCMDIQAVTERLQLLSGETAEQLTRWAPVIASAVRMVELRMFDATDPADERLIHLAAVKRCVCWSSPGGFKAATM